MLSALVSFAAVLADSSANPVVCKGTVCKPYNQFPKRMRQSANDQNSVSCPSAYVVDGDTLRCGRDRIRLLGIDAPEVERCPKWRVCAPGDGQASKRSLIAAVSSGPVNYQPVTRDRYGRTVAVVRAGTVNLSCWQLQHEQAIYKLKWDTGQFIARECR